MVHEWERLAILTRSQPKDARASTHCGEFQDCNFQGTFFAIAPTPFVPTPLTPPKSMQRWVKRKAEDELQEERPMEHAVDVSTCKSILLRRGPGGFKHLDTKQLWVQDAVTEKRIRVLKINRDENPTDTLASYSSARIMQKHVRMMGCEVG